MSDSSAGHCAKHRKYRCDHCETLYEDSYHDDWDEVVRDQEKRIEELEADKQRLWDSIEAGESVYKRKYEALREANDVCTLHCMEITGHLDKLRDALELIANRPGWWTPDVAVAKAALEVDDE